jgi:hypothetical protein
MQPLKDGYLKKKIEYLVDDSGGDRIMDFWIHALATCGTAIASSKVRFAGWL